MRNKTLINTVSTAIALFATVALFNGCSKEIRSEENLSGEAELQFVPTVSTAAETKSPLDVQGKAGILTCEEGLSLRLDLTAEEFPTKADLVNTSGENISLSDAGVTTFRVCAVNDDGSAFVPCTKDVNYFDGKWRMSKNYFWKNKVHRRFYACANFDEKIEMFPKVDGSVEFTTKLSVPDNAGEQKDFILAMTISDGDSDADGITDGIVPLQFDHVCTSVIFKCGTMTGIDAISHISLEGVTGRREYDFTYNVDGSVKEGITKDPYTKTVYTIVEGALPAEGGILGCPFILIPQNLASTPVKVRVKATAYGREYEFIGNLDSGEWMQGKINTYTINPAGSFDPADDDPLCFASEGPQSVYFDKYQADGTTASLEYSTDKINWTTWADPSTPVNFNGTLYIRGLNVNGFHTENDIVSTLETGFVFGDQAVAVTLSGDIMSVIDYRMNTTIPNNGCFWMFFKDQACIKSASALKLPSTGLTYAGLGGLFYNCTELVDAPMLPATKLAPACYWGMFFECESLAACPELPALQLEMGCYSYMFEKCNSIVTTCELPATKLAPDCYANMFDSCENLETAKNLPATQLEEECYTEMFYNCTKLEVAPCLPAATLKTKCYARMFRGCESLAYIKMMATDISASGCLSSWVENVAPSGTFVKSRSLGTRTNYEDDNTRICIDSPSGIPIGWTAKSTDLSSDSDLEDWEHNSEGINF